MAISNNPPDRLDELRDEIRETWAHRTRLTAVTAELIREARDLCRSRKISFDTWCLEGNLGISRSRIYEILGSDPLVEQRRAERAASEANFISQDRDVEPPPAEVSQNNIVISSAEPEPLVDDANEPQPLPDEVRNPRPWGGIPEQQAKEISALRGDAQKVQAAPSAPQGAEAEPPAGVTASREPKPKSSWDRDYPFPTRVVTLSITQDDDRDLIYGVECFVNEIGARRALDDELENMWCEPPTSMPPFRQGDPDWAIAETQIQRDCRSHLQSRT
jgi:hypothetical protein